MMRLNARCLDRKSIQPRLTSVGVFIRIAVALIVCSIAAEACNIPVFRFALERWKPDACEAVVFFDQSLPGADEELVAELESASIVAGGLANLKIVRCDLSNNSDPELKKLWLATKDRSDSKLPTVVVRSQKGQGQTINHWHGSLSNLKAAGLLGSPARTELTKRLQNGDAIVWLLLKSSDETKTQVVKEMLSQQCRALPNKVELPEGIGLPGSELYSELPLLLQFSVLELDRNDPREQYLVRQLAGFQTEAFQANEPLIVPVFGRGRALEVIPATDLNADLMFELTEFLCGACSCQVKEQNPGFDLLLSTDWNLALFGEDSDGPPPEAATGNGQQRKPQTVPIPPGRKGKQ